MSKALGLTAPASHSTTSGSRSLQQERLFYFLAAVAVAVVAVIGFRSFFLQGRGFGGNPLTHQIVPLILVHAAAMCCWVILFTAQSALILAGNRRLHMVLGAIGGLLAGAIVVLGTAMAILSAHYNPEAYRMFGGGRFFL